MGLNHWIWHNNHFKTHFVFLIFGRGDPFQLRSWSEGWLKQVSEVPYHTEFVLLCVDHFSFFSTKGGGVRRLVDNFTFFFFEPFPYPPIACYYWHNALAWVWYSLRTSYMITEQWAYVINNLLTVDYYIYRTNKNNKLGLSCPKLSSV